MLSFRLTLHNEWPTALQVKRKRKKKGQLKIRFETEEETK
jgi:hypothetical protein